MDAVKKAEKNKEISEDEKKIYESEIDDLTDEFIKKIEDITKQKEEELLTV